MEEVDGAWLMAVEEIQALSELASAVADELDTYAVADVGLHNLCKLKNGTFMFLTVLNGAWFSLDTYLHLVNAGAAFLLENWYMESNWGDNFVGASC